jgi:hypothetical protein
MCNAVQGDKIVSKDDKNYSVRQKKLEYSKTPLSK